MDYIVARKRHLLQASLDSKPWKRVFTFNLNFLGAKMYPSLFRWLLDNIFSSRLFSVGKQSGCNLREKIFQEKIQTAVWILGSLDSLSTRHKLPRTSKFILQVYLWWITLYHITLSSIQIFDAPRNEVNKMLSYHLHDNRIHHFVIWRFSLFFDAKCCQNEVGCGLFEAQTFFLSFHWISISLILTAKAKPTWQTKFASFKNHFI